MAGATHLVKPPLGLVAEITHRCPMKCIYCSNPVELVRRESEMETAEWLSLLDQAAELGVLQVHFTGGEPLQRRDLLTLIGRASELGMFTNLITSGIGLTRETMQALAELDLGSFQLSLQGSDGGMVEAIGGGPFWAKKMKAAAMVKAHGLSLSVNAVLHRRNLHQAGALVELADALGADRIELANTQYYGWALANRDDLMPTRDQLDAASHEIERVRATLGRSMEILWVIPDYFEDFPKACTGGWGQNILSVSPDGRVLPCLGAYVLPDLDLPSILDHSLRWIWHESPAFNAYRGEAWMREPCSSCPMRSQDHGGCRCQAYLLTGDARNTDPVCVYSPHHGTVLGALPESATVRPADPVVYRDFLPAHDRVSLKGRPRH